MNNFKRLLENYKNFKVGDDVFFIDPESNKPIYASITKKMGKKGIKILEVGGTAHYYIVDPSDLKKVKDGWKGDYFGNEKDPLGDNNKWFK